MYSLRTFLTKQCLNNLRNIHILSRYLSLITRFPCRFPKKVFIFKWKPQKQSVDGSESTQTTNKLPLKTGGDPMVIKEGICPVPVRTAGDPKLIGAARLTRFGRWERSIPPRTRPLATQPTAIRLPLCILINRQGTILGTTTAPRGHTIN